MSCTEREEIINALEVIKNVCEENKCRESCPFNRGTVCKIQDSCPANWEIVEKFFWKALD